MSPPAKRNRLMAFLSMRTHLLASLARCGAKGVRALVLASLVLASAAASGLPAHAQQAAPVPPMPIPSPVDGEPSLDDPAGSAAAYDNATAAQPSLEMLLNENMPALMSPEVLPYAPSGTADTGKPGDPDNTTLYMMARLTPDGPLIDSGLVWRVYSDTINEQGELDLIATSEGGDAEFRLDPGTYLVHTAYGHAGVTTKLSVQQGQTSRTVVFNAGGIKLNSAVSKTIPLNSAKVRFDIYGTEFNARGERKLIARNVRPGTIVPLNAGTYHITSRYGRVNATVRADIRVEPGKLTEATIYHNASEITLKLVNSFGGEAIANTAWSILTPSGDSVVEGDGAFPTYVLVAGKYTVVARNQGRLFSRNFEVTPGHNTEVEVRTEDGNAAGLATE
ncbi:hypothetical protein [Breoghania sp.]|uniref:hypothetical protein n=1 Tax=Breoghania sp. TaxID=2065378 RepID=UPI002AA6D179|nr:hypothetical protein [Breoghania sp.]